MNTKKLGSALAAGMLSAALVLAGCGGTASDPAAADKTEGQATESVDASTDKLVGGWQAFGETTLACTDEEKAIFDKAVDGLDGVNYEPVRVLGTQVVAGTNYAFLARGTTVAAEPVTQWYVLVAYRDLDGNVSLTSVQPIELAEPKVTDEATSDNIAGGWAINDSVGSSLESQTQLEPQEADEAFTTASDSYDGITLHPLTTLGTQLVSGTNYLVLCEGVPEGGTNAQLYLATIYADLDGGAQITDMRGFNLLGYLE
jgi:hypothetical protein